MIFQRSTQIPLPKDFLAPNLLISLSKPFTIHWFILIITYTFLPQVTSLFQMKRKVRYTVKTSANPEDLPSLLVFKDDPESDCTTTMFYLSLPACIEWTHICINSHLNQDYFPSPAWHETLPRYGKCIGPLSWICSATVQGLWRTMWFQPWSSCLVIGQRSL